MNTYTFHVSGTHCSSCKIFIEDTLNEQIGIQQTHVDLKHETVSIETTLEESQYKLAEILTEKIKHNGYSLSVEKKSKEKKKTSRKCECEDDVRGVERGRSARGAR